MLCGISVRFQTLSPSERQVTHALLTRPPLSHILLHPKDPQSSFVRLACVKHAASVRPEPGSNSLKIISKHPMVFKPFLELNRSLVNADFTFLNLVYRNFCCTSCFRKTLRNLFRVFLSSLFNFQGACHTNRRFWRKVLLLYHYIFTMSRRISKFFYFL